MTQSNGEWKGGIWYPQVNNAKGNNQHTAKSKLKGKPKHKYELLSRDEQFEELRRLYAEKRYYQSMGLSYAQRIAFLIEKMGIEPKKSESDARAEKDFKEKEGME